LTIGPKVNATFLAALQGDGVIVLCMYSYPNNLTPTIMPNDPTRLYFKAVSDIDESNEIIIDIVWDGKWVEGRTEMAEHLIVKQCAV